MQTLIHRITGMTPGQRNDTTWLTINGDGGTVTMFVDADLAEALAEAFDKYQDWLAGQDGAA